MSRSMSDLVRDSRIDTRFLPDTIVHTYTTSDLGARQRRGLREETWQRQRFLGHGNFGEVWMQRCSGGQRRDQLRAVKEVPKRNGSAVDYTRELEAIAKFSHKKYRHCFVQSYGWYEHETSMFITMEFLELGDLQKYLGRPFPESQAQEIASQLIEGTDFMHDNGFAHRDLKPLNILVVQPQPAWWVKIGDFGLSKRTVGTELTSNAGTPGYQAPEVLFHSQQRSYNVAVDIWAVGQITFQMITNRLAFSGDDAGDDLSGYFKHSRQFPETLLVRRNASPLCCEFIKSTMAASPDDRPKAKDLVRHAWLTRTSPWMERPLQTRNELSFLPATSNPLQDQDSVNTDASTSWSYDDKPAGTSSRELTSLSIPRSIEYTEKLNNAALEATWPSQTKRDTILQTDAPAGRFLLGDHHTASEFEDRVVIGLDFGTTSCSMAYAFSHIGIEQISSILEWPGTAPGRVTQFVPTVIAYDESVDNKPFKWGAQVDWEKDAVMGANPYQPNQSDRSEKTKGQLIKLRKNPVHVAADFISAICEHVLSIIESRATRDYFLLCHKQFILSFPYNCSEQAKDRILRAANMAGLHPITLINELVAAALYALHKHQRTLFVGDAFVVCDAGDGTINLTTCEVLNMVPCWELEEIGPGSSGVPGAIILNHRFAEAVENVVGNEQWDRLSKSRAWARAENEFNNVKWQFKGDVDEEYFITFPQAGLKDNPEQNLKNDCWILAGKKLKSIFDPVVQDIIRGIDHQVKRAILERQGRGIKGIILIGEFGMKEYLKSSIEKEYPNMQVIRPDDALAASVKGAVLSGLVAQIDSSLTWGELVQPGPDVLTQEEPVPIAGQPVVGESSVVAGVSWTQTTSVPAVVTETQKEELSIRCVGAIPLQPQPSQPEVMLFDGENAANVETQRAITFFKILDEFHDSYSRFVTKRVRIRKEEESKKCLRGVKEDDDSWEESPRRIRIAVLDTGIDFQHPGILEAKANGRVKEEWCHSWVGADAKDEDDGLHGTNCAYLLHKAAPEVDIYVEKVFERNSFRSYEAENIDRAINHAVKTWDVDIISMSFGLRRLPPRTDRNQAKERLALQKFQDLVDNIETAIRDASAQSPRIMFAAASNDGKNGKRAFPARYNPWVICVHASDGNGNDGGINPLLKSDANFMTLGMGNELMEREWVPVGGRLILKYYTVYRSGILFATPVAAGIVATVLDLAARVEAINDRARRKLERYEEMEKVLRLMLTLEYHHYSYLAPWNLWETAWQTD